MTQLPVTVPTPLTESVVASATVHVSVLDCPVISLAGEAENTAMVGLLVAVACRGEDLSGTEAIPGTATVSRSDSNVRQCMNSL